MTVMRRDREIRPDGRTTKESVCRDSWYEKRTLGSAECGRSSTILLRGLQGKQVPRLSQVSGRRQSREPLVKQMRL